MDLSLDQTAEDAPARAAGKAGGDETDAHDVIVELVEIQALDSNSRVGRDEDRAVPRRYSSRAAAGTFLHRHFLCGQDDIAVPISDKCGESFRSRLLG